MVRLPTTDARTIHPRIAEYTSKALPSPDAVLRRVKNVAQDAGIPSITPDAGRTLQLVARGINARRALELGTGTGYSGIWIARGLAPRGRLVTIEGDAKHAEMARRHFRAAGVGRSVEVRVALCLDAVGSFRPGSLDFVFADATKAEYPDYLEAAERALRNGGVLAADNVFWQGRVLDHDPAGPKKGWPSDADTRGILEFTRRLRSPRWTTMIFPFGDGLSVSIKN